MLRGSYDEVTSNLTIRPDMTKDWVNHWIGLGWVFKTGSKTRSGLGSKFIGAIG